MPLVGRDLAAEDGGAEDVAVVDNTHPSHRTHVTELPDGGHQRPHHRAAARVSRLRGLAELEAAAASYVKEQGKLEKLPAGDRDGLRLLGFPSVLPGRAPDLAAVGGRVYADLTAPAGSRTRTSGTEPGQNPDSADRIRGRNETSSRRGPDTPYSYR